MLGLLAVVALASRGGSAGRGDTAGRGPSNAFWDYLYTTTLVLMALGAVLLVYTAVWGRAELADARRRRGDRTIAGLVFFALAIALVVGLRALRDGDAAPGTTTMAQPTATQFQRTRTAPRREREPEFQWAPVVALGVAGGATAAFFALRRRLSRTRAAADDEALTADLAALLDDTIDDLLAEPDPRRAVIAAYARMERSLAVHGVARHEAEAPLEFLHRASGELHARHPAARRLLFELTHLFERAKFSPHAVDRTMKDEAIATLSALRAELREEAA